jgi:hypothetical protein
MTAVGGVFRTGPLPVRAGEKISYFFTYNTAGQSFDSSSFEYSQPAQEQPLALRAQVAAYASGYELQLVSLADLAWVDVHYTINNGPQQNLRMPAGDTLRRLPIWLNSSDILRYSITYSDGQFVADSAWTEYRASQARRIVVDVAADSTSGSCRTDGVSNGSCNLRAAVLAAHTLGGRVSIELAVDPKIDQGEILVSAPSETSSLQLTIEPKRGTAPKTITGSATSSLFRVLANASLSLQDLTITNFYSFGGGAVATNYGSLELRNTAVVNNRTACSGVGAMTAFANCSGGAISNAGKMSVSAASRFEQNSVTATASTASYTTADAFGGAISSGGTVVVRTPVAFINNASTATASSGVHPMPFGGASASSVGGALANYGGKLLILGAGSCSFVGNAANASASTIKGDAVSSSRGGAIYSSGGVFQLSSACTFSNNHAQQDPNVANP